MSARLSLALCALVVFCVGYMLVQSLVLVLADHILAVLLAFIDSVLKAVSP